MVDPNAAPTPPPNAPPTTAPGPAPSPVTGIAPTPAPTPTLRPNPAPGPVTGIAPTGPVVSPGSPTPSVPLGPPPSLPAPKPTSQLVAVPTDLTGQTSAAACAELKAMGLPCAVQYVAQLATTSKPDVVAATKPNSGSVAKGTSVELDVDELAVPRPAGATDPGTYCAQADAAGFACSTQDLGPGSPTNTVVSVNPTGGTLEPPGHAVVASYHSSSPPPPPVVVPDCSGMAPSACSMPAGLTAVTSSQTTASGVACNAVYSQTPAKGTAVPPGSTVTLIVDPYCAAPLYELHRTGTDIWYLTTSGTQPAGTPASAWTRQSYAAYAYPIQNGSCAKAGTVPLYEWRYPPGGAAGKYHHYYFTDLSTWHDAGWVAQGPITCVFNSAAPGSIAAYAHYINRPLVPGDWSWELQPNPAEPSPVWYQLQHP
ncbi:MAG: PASTA domain-containing protein [Actinomycetota bacterium]|nr:PASTA domain-containing protein [Actinomycetota bacterium]